MLRVIFSLYELKKMKSKTSSEVHNLGGTVPGSLILLSLIEVVFAYVQGISVGESSLVDSRMKRLDFPISRFFSYFGQSLIEIITFSKL